MRKYWISLKNSFQSRLEYRGKLLSDAFVLLWGFAITFFLWRKLTSDYTNVGRYDFYGIVAYYLLGGIFRVFSTTETSKLFEIWVREGRLSDLLLKPFSPVTALFFNQVGSLFAALLLNLAIFVPPLFLIAGLRSSIFITLIKLLWVMIFIILYYIFGLFFYFLVGTLSFWTVSLSGIRNSVNQFLNIVKGHWIPLDLAPMAVQKILSFLPFQYAFFYPIKILTSNELAVSDHLRGVVVLIVSIVATVLIDRFLWFKGLRRYSAVGA